MTIQDLGSIGEFISALIIIVTLIYIAIQSKQNQNLMRSSAFQYRTSTAIDMYQQVVSSEHMSRILVKNRSGQELSEEEKIRLTFWQLCLLKAGENIHYQLEIGVLEDEFETTISDALIQTIKTAPGMRTTWEESRMQFRVSFQKYVDERL
ncbi:MAG: hypothetical protein HOC70_13350 [Gammaproteobacteria bacterium]|jgi:hypothetical protein|nr:hypothetical protein [Gammaproteobacteria bacterium]MBT4494221.1 hypothetical protein [Gammaproteobacteria bacterium]